MFIDILGNTILDNKYRGYFFFFFFKHYVDRVDSKYFFLPVSLFVEFDDAVFVAIFLRVVDVGGILLDVLWAADDTLVANVVVALVVIAVIVVLVESCTTFKSKGCKKEINELDLDSIINHKTSMRGSSTRLYYFSMHIFYKVCWFCKR